MPTRSEQRRVNIQQGKSVNYGLEPVTTEYIEREAVLQAIMKAQESLETNIDKEWTKNKPYFKGLAWANRLIIDTPAADVVEVEHGEWIEIADVCGIKVLKCSVCGVEHPRQPTAYCCDCGAKMDGKED